MCVVGFGLICYFLGRRRRARIALRDAILAMRQLEEGNEAKFGEKPKMYDVFVLGAANSKASETIQVGEEPSPQSYLLP